MGATILPVLQYTKLPLQWEIACDQASESERIWGMWEVCENRKRFKTTEVRGVSILQQKGDAFLGTPEEQAEEKEACMEAKKLFYFDMAYQAGLDKVSRKTFKIMRNTFDQYIQDKDDEHDFDQFMKNDDEIKADKVPEIEAFYEMKDSPIANEKWIVKKAAEADLTESDPVLKFALKTVKRRDEFKKEVDKYDSKEHDFYTRFKTMLETSNEFKIRSRTEKGEDNYGKDKDNVKKEENEMEQILEKLTEDLYKEVEDGKSAKEKEFNAKKKKMASVLKVKELGVKDIFPRRGRAMPMSEEVKARLEKIKTTS